MKLLIADDESIERAALTFILQNSNLEIELVGEAKNGRQAVAKSLKYLPDIVIMDIKMPGIDGLEAAGQIKAALPDCKIIMLTAYGYFDFAQTAIKIGVEDYIVKPVNSENLIKVIQKVLTKIEEEKLRKSKYVETETKLRQVTEYFRNEILSSMIAGDIEEERIGEYILHLGITFKQGIAVVASSNKEPLALLETGFKRWVEDIKETFANYEVECLLNHQRNRLNLLLILNDMVESKQLTPLIFNELESRVKQLDSHWSIGISKPFTEISSVSRAFFQAGIACSKSDDRIIFYDQIKIGEKGNLKYPLDKEKALYERLIKGEREGVIEAFHKIWDWMVQTSETNEELKKKAYQLIVIIHRLIIEDFNIDERIEDYRSGLQPLNHLNEVGDYCRNTLLNFLTKICEEMKEPSALIIDEVCRYIGANYMNEITLDSIASHVGFSRFYFSKLFKQFKGVNFIDYLTLVRINKSKELLKDPKLSVKDISYTVGYSDPNYYTSVFKKTEGITPTEYRSRCI